MKREGGIAASEGHCLQLTQVCSADQPSTSWLVVDPWAPLPPRKHNRIRYHGKYTHTHTHTHTIHMFLPAGNKFLWVREWGQVIFQSVILADLSRTLMWEASYCNPGKSFHFSFGKCENNCNAALLPKLDSELKSSSRRHNNSNNSSQSFYPGHHGVSWKNLPCEWQSHQDVRLHTRQVTDIWFCFTIFCVLNIHKVPRSHCFRLGDFCCCHPGAFCKILSTPDRLV